MKALSLILVGLLLFTVVISPVTAKMPIHTVADDNVKYLLVFEGKQYDTLTDENSLTYIYTDEGLLWDAKYYLSARFVDEVNSYAHLKISVLSCNFGTTPTVLGTFDEHVYNLYVPSNPYKRIYLGNYCSEDLDRSALRFTYAGSGGWVYSKKELSNPFEVARKAGFTE